LRDGEKRNIKNRYPDVKKRQAMVDGLHQTQGMADGDGDLEVPWGATVGDIPNRYTSDVVLN
jgi:hypothetical protein